MTSYLFELNKYDEEYTKYFKDVISNNNENMNIELQYYYNTCKNIIEYEQEQERLRNIWFEIKKDLDMYQIAQRANIYHFQTFIEKINN